MIEDLDLEAMAREVAAVKPKPQAPISQSDLEAMAKEVADASRPSVLEEVADLPVRVARGAVRGAGLMVGGVGALERKGAQMLPGALGDAAAQQGTMLQGAGRAVGELAPRANPKLDSDLASQTFEGVGSSVPIIGMGLATGPGAPAAVTAGVAGLSSMATEAGAGYEEAKQRGGTDEQALDAAAITSLAGALDVLPEAGIAIRLLRRGGAGAARKAAAGALERLLIAQDRMGTLGALAATAGAEGAQETAQGLWEQYAQELVGTIKSDEDARSLWDITQQDGTPGALAGAIMEGVTRWLTRTKGFDARRGTRSTLTSADGQEVGGGALPAQGQVARGSTDVSGLSRGPDAEVAKDAQAVTGAAGQVQRSGLRSGLPQAGQADSGALQGVRGQEGGDAPRGLHDAAGGDVALPEASSGATSRLIEMPDAELSGALDRSHAQRTLQFGKPGRLDLDPRAVPDLYEAPEYMKDRAGAVGARVAMFDGGPGYGPIGFYDRTAKTILIDARATPEEQGQALLQHELTHFIADEHPEVFEQFKSAIEAIQPGLLAKMAADRTTRQREMTTSRTELSAEQATEEGVAETLQNIPSMAALVRLDRDLAFKVATHSPNLLRRVADALIDFAKTLGLTRKGSIGRIIRELEAEFEQSGTDVEKRLGPQKAAKLALKVAELEDSIRGEGAQVAQPTRNRMRRAEEMEFPEVEPDAAFPRPELPLKQIPTSPLGERLFMARANLQRTEDAIERNKGSGAQARRRERLERRLPEEREKVARLESDVRRDAPKRVGDVVLLPSGERGRVVKIEGATLRVDVGKGRLGDPDTTLGLPEQRVRQIASNAVEVLARPSAEKVGPKPAPAKASKGPEFKIPVAQPPKKNLPVSRAPQQAPTPIAAPKAPTVKGPEFQIPEAKKPKPKPIRNPEATFGDLVKVVALKSEPVKAPKQTAPVASEPPKSAREGVLRLPDGRRMQVRYRFVEADAILPTHDARQGFKKNEGADKNERPYEDATEGKGERDKVYAYAQDPDPSFLTTDTPSASDGPPIVTLRDGKLVVLGGNGRAMAMQLSYSRSGAQAETVRQGMIEAAKRFGYETADVEAMTAPVLVREISAEDAGAPGELSRALNDQFTKKKTPIAEAVSMGSKIDEVTARTFANLLGDATFAEVMADKRNVTQVIGALVQNGALTHDVASTLVDKRGLLTGTGRDTIENALLGAAVGDVRTLAELDASTRQTIMRALPSIVSLRSTWPAFRGILAHALDGISSLRTSKLKLEDSLRQLTIEDEPWKHNEFSVALIRAFRNDTPTQFARRLGTLSQGIKDVNAGQGSMFGSAEARTPEEEFRRNVSIGNAHAQTRKLEGQGIQGGTPAQPSAGGSGQAKLPLGPEAPRDPGLFALPTQGPLSPVVLAPDAVDNLGEPQLTMLFGADPERVSTTAQRQADFKEERAAARGDTHPSDDERLGKLLSRTAGALTLKPNERLSTLIKGYVEDRLPAFNVVGKTIIDAYDAAALFAAIRSPFIERVSYIIATPDGKVVRSGVYTIGSVTSALMPLEPMIGLVAPLPTGMTVWVSHNHPSGGPLPSNADHSVYGRFAEALGARGHTFRGIITDGNSFVDWRDSFHYSELSYEERPANKYQGPHFEKAPLIMSVPQAVEFFRAIQFGKNTVVALLHDAKLRIRGVSAFIAPPTQGAVLLARQEVGAGYVQLATEDYDTWNGLVTEHDRRRFTSLIDVVLLRPDGTYLSAADGMARKGVFFAGPLDDPDPNGVVVQQFDETPPPASVSFAIPLNPKSGLSKGFLKKAVENYGADLGDEQTARTSKAAQTRAFQAGIRAARLDELEPEHNAEDYRIAKRAIREDKDLRSKLVKKLIDRGEFSKWETVALSMLADRAAQTMSGRGTIEAIREAGKLRVLYEDLRRRQAQVLQVIRDPFKDYKEGPQALSSLLSVANRKNRDKLNRILKALDDSTLGPDARFALEKELDAIQEEESKTTQKVLRQLRDAGLDPELVTLDYFHDPYVFSRAARIAATAKATPKDWFIEWRYASMLGGPMTQIRNITGNAASMAYTQVLERVAESLVNVAARNPNAASFGELPSYFKAWVPGLAQAGHNFLMAMNTELPVFEMDLARKGANIPGLSARDNLDVGRQAIPGFFGRALRYPSTTMLLAFDEFFKTLAAHTQAVSLAYRAASAEKLKGAAHTKRMGEILLDYSHPIHQQALETTKREVLFQGSDPVLKSLIQGRKAIDKALHVPIGTIALPFVTVPYNIFKSGLGIPFAPAKAVHGALTGSWKNQPGLREHQIAEALLGMAVSLAVVYAVRGDDDKDRITGSRATDYGKALLQERTSPPQSFKVGGNWLSFAAIEPLSVALTTIVDLGEELHSHAAQGHGAQAEAALGRLASSLIAQASDKTWLRTLGDLYKLVTNPQSGGAARFTRDTLVTPMIPNIVRAPARATDAFMRQNTVRQLDDQGVWERAGRSLGYEALPIARRAPPIRSDLWGRDVLRAGRSFGARLIWPMPENGVPDVSSLDILMRRFNDAVADGRFPDEKPLYPRPPDYDYIGADGRRHFWDDEQYARLTKEAGELAAQTLLSDRSLRYDDPGPDDADKIKKALAKARKTVRERLIAKIQK